MQEKLETQQGAWSRGRRQLSDPVKSHQEGKHKENGGHSPPPVQPDEPPEGASRYEGEPDLPPADCDDRTVRRATTAMRDLGLLRWQNPPGA